MAVSAIHNAAGFLVAGMLAWTGVMSPACASARLAVAAAAPHGAQPAEALPAAPESGCMDHHRYVSHVSYRPSAPDRAFSCGHLLSTDTVLSVHHWDRT